MFGILEIGSEQLLYIERNSIFIYAYELRMRRISRIRNETHDIIWGAAKRAAKLFQRGSSDAFAVF